MASSPDGEENKLIIPNATDTSAKILFVVKNINESLHILDEDERIVHRNNATRKLTILLFNTGTEWRAVELLES